jgi:hypothetical protein
MVDHYIEDVFLPDILLEILSKNRVYENFDLYSDENKILYEIRASYLDQIVREMIKETVKTTTDDLVNHYLRRRFPDKDANERDPLVMVRNNLFDEVLRAQIRLIAGEAVKDLTFEYMLETQVNSLLNRVLIPREVERTVLETIEEMAIREIIDGYLEALTIEVCPVIATGCIQASKDKREKAELKHMFDEFLDRCLLESGLENLARLYEEEEAQLHLREHEKKTEREKVKHRNDMAKMGMREVDQAIKDNSHPHFDPDSLDTDKGDMPAPLITHDKEGPHTTRLQPPIDAGSPRKPDPDGSVRRR